MRWERRAKAGVKAGNASRANQPHHGAPIMGRLAQTLLCLLTFTGMQSLPGIALGQNPQSAPPGASPAPVTPPGPSTTPPERVSPSGNDQGDKTLSDKLSRQRGTLSPPDVDPGMAVKPDPSTHGTMPVLPPPGSPGGNRSVVPK
jgi:hypothetical protein